MKKEYKCSKCGLEIVVVWVSSTKKKIIPLQRVECQDCGTRTMRIDNG